MYTGADDNSNQCPITQSAHQEEDAALVNLVDLLQAIDNKENESASNELYMLDKDGKIIYF